MSAATEEVVYYLSRELVKLCCDVTIVDIMDRKRLASDLHIIEMPYFSFIKTTKSNSPGLIAKRLSFSFFSAMRLQTLKHDFDVIHFHNQFPAFMFQLFARPSSKKFPKIVYTVHNPIWGLPDSEMPKDVRLKFALEVAVLKNACKVIAVSETLKRNMIKRLSLKSSSIVAIPNGVDTDLFHPCKATSTLRKELAPNGEKIILCVGRISRFKGQKMLVDAIPEITRENPIVRFVFVGPMDDAQYSKEINSTIRLQSLEKYCIFTGNVPSNSEIFCYG
jgi:glycosyltransferase involved in cell wall biosynthesis